MNSIGVFGGTFDPIHYGHLRLAQELAFGLGLDEVRFVPAGQPPHRAAPQVSAPQRCDMVRLAIAGNPLFALDDREVLKHGPCYTYDTLSELRHELGGAQPLCLLLGTDQFLGFATWHRWQEIFELAHVVVAHRPGFPQITWTDSLPHALQQELNNRMQTNPQALSDAPCGAILPYVITALDISASHIRMGLRTGISPRYLLPDAVLDYIQTYHLYLSEPHET